MFPFVNHTKELRVFIWPIEITSNVPSPIGNGSNVWRQFRTWRQNDNNWSFLLTDFFNMVDRTEVDRTDPGALSHPCSSHFKVTLSAVTFFITYLDSIFFLLLLLFLFFLHSLPKRNSNEKFGFKINILFCIKGDSP